MSKVTRSYLAYLIRLSRENEAAPWRASLEDPHTGEHRRFARAQDLFAFLEAQMAGQPAPLDQKRPEPRSTDDD